MPFSRSLRSQQGFTVVEVMVAILLLLIGVLGAVALIDAANARTATNRAREAGTNLAREIVEATRGVRYDQLTPPTIVTELQAQPGLADAGAGAGWTIRRRGVTYTVTPNVCTVDDPADDSGAHVPGFFCGPTAGTGIDRNPDDYRRVDVEVAWTRGSSTTRVKQTTIVTNPASTLGPSVKDLTMTEPSASPITLASTPRAKFHVTTNSVPDTVSWYLDGNAQAASAVGSGTSWDFEWPLDISVYDGTYYVSARAFRNDESGATKTVTVKLNRYAPFAPNGFQAGLNGGILEFEWLANRERDIQGYRVYRMVGASPASGDELVCPLQKETSCFVDAPAGFSSEKYYVVAVDLDTSDLQRNGDPSDVRTVTAGVNNPPFPPVGPLGFEDPNDGTVVLKWSAPVPPDPDAGDGIAFYRIYRDGTAYADRYDRTGSGSEVTYTDKKLGGQSHTYWVTAVDDHLSESTLTGPVTAP
jgi:prepilin-type N-terminal cleavage/methylation domain-containing protein